MTALKNDLFESEKLVDNHLVSKNEWDEVKQSLHIHNIDKVEDRLLQEIQSKKTGMINLQKFMDILDLFQVIPSMKSKAAQ